MYDYIKKVELAHSVFHGTGNYFRETFFNSVAGIFFCLSYF
ncbi:hypothetical protein SAMN05428949_0492 [Chitinophaga sp. YR627]|nr:hypothetical protein SAMN05428949_0492 [Chitinophaga sp. YR627]